MSHPLRRAGHRDSFGLSRTSLIQEAAEPLSLKGETKGETAVILLTGATGTAGSFITNEFVRERVPVRILVRNRAKAAGEKVPTVEIVEGDMAKRSTLGPALDASTGSS